MISRYYWFIWGVNYIILRNLFMDVSRETIGFMQKIIIIK